MPEQYQGPIWILVEYKGNNNRFHWILMNIEVDMEEFKYSTHKIETWNSSATCRICSRSNFNYFRTISVSFVDLLRYQVINNSFIYFLCRAVFGNGSKGWLRVCLDVGIFARKWIQLKIPNLRWKGNDLHFQFRCLDVHGNSCENQRIAPNFKSCLDVQNMELNFDLGLGFFALYISKFLIFI
jgi:hypothetical protein